MRVLIYIAPMAVCWDFVYVAQYSVQEWVANTDVRDEEEGEGEEGRRVESEEECVTTDSVTGRGCSSRLSRL